MRYGTPEYEEYYRNGFRSEKARLEAEKWQKDLMLWIEANQPERLPFPEQPKIGYATFHWLWVLGHPDGVWRDYTASNVREVDLFRRHDGTYLWR